MKNYVHPGDTITVVAPSNVASGDLVIIGGLVGVAVADADSGAEVEIMTRGVFDLPKTSAQAWATVGLAIYGTTSGPATTSTSDTTLIGKNVATAANPSAIGRVRLNG